ncbi:CdaR family transcriptional regulator [Enterococcus nangangensis]|uniref:CdaR family transcriptional regulator n=1 Tax=Enterococcus nangangensis TaxID=2559926 RepID=UPI00148547A4|nr:sugar diacid recognition domain-containing protein [Enterococcus nangangensis]
MSSLTKEQAALIVRKLMDDIPYNINIMNDQGRIIASGHPERIGSRHRAAERAIREGRMVEVDQDTPLEKQGTNEPIIYQGEVIGVVGISGAPVEVRPFTKLVKTIALMLIEDLALYKKQEESRLAKVAFIQQLLQAPHHYDEVLQQEALSRYHLMLGQNYRTLYASDLTFFKKYYPQQELFAYEEGWIIFVREKDFIALPKVATSFTGFLLSTTSAVYLAESLLKIRHTLLFLQLMGYDAGSYATEDFFFSQFLSFPVAPNPQLLEKVTAAREYFPTLVEFVKNRSSINQTAEKLHIHRNTLNYRLQKLQQITGKDPHLWFELWELLYHFAYQYPHLAE